MARRRHERLEIRLNFLAAAGNREGGGHPPEPRETFREKIKDAQHTQQRTSPAEGARRHQKVRCHSRPCRAAETRLQRKAWHCCCCSWTLLPPVHAVPAHSLKNHHFTVVANRSMPSPLAGVVQAPAAATAVAARKA